jgi:hypothetical protein
MPSTSNILARLMRSLDRVLSRCVRPIFAPDVDGFPKSDRIVFARSSY